MLKQLITFTLVLHSFLYLKAQSVGIGGQFGDPSGLSLRINNAGALNYDILAAWDFDDYFFVNLHGLWEQSLAPAPQLNYFYGPGIFMGFRDRGRWEDDDVYLGLSGTLGLNVYIQQRLEIYGQVTPRLALVPDTDGDVGGGIGLRFYFK
jgi:hypothetical protein